MSDSVNGVKPAGPAWPVKPVTPASKDREAGDRRKQPQAPQPDANPDEDESKPTIDEYV